MVAERKITYEDLVKGLRAGVCKLIDAWFRFDPPWYIDNYKQTTLTEFLNNDPKE
jgi:hypothetical protein